jgi:hypothetical protein
MNRVPEAASSTFKGQVLFEQSIDPIKYNDPRFLVNKTLTEFKINRKELGRSVHRYDHVSQNKRIAANIHSYNHNLIAFKHSVLSKSNNQNLQLLKRSYENR